MSKTGSSPVTLGFLWCCCCWAINLSWKQDIFHGSFSCIKTFQILTKTIEEISLLIKLFINGFFKIKMAFILLLKRMKQTLYCYTCLEFIFHFLLYMPPLCHQYIIHYVLLIVFTPTIVSRWCRRILDTRD